jgi:hypothetical protein
MNTPFVEYAFVPKRTDGGDLWPTLLALADEMIE